MAGESRVLLAEERLRELRDNTGTAEIGKRVLGGTRGHDRAIRQRLAGPMVIGDDHVHAETLRLLDLGDSRDSAVDGENELHALLGELGDCRGRNPVTLLEPAREMPDDVGTELTERQRRERRRADAVDVVVAMDTDPLPPFDRQP